MKNLIILVIIFCFGNMAIAQKKAVSDTTNKKEQKNIVSDQNPGNKKQDSTQVHITPSASGVKRSLGYKFSSSTEMSEPGNGVFRFDKENPQDAGFMIVDNIDISGEDQSKWFSTWDKNTGATGRGRVTVADIGGKIITVMDFTNVFIDAAGFWKLPVKFVSGTLPSDGSVYYYVFERIAHNPETIVASQPVQAAVAVPVTGAVAVTQVDQVQTVIPVEANQVQDVKQAAVIQIKDTVIVPPQVKVTDTVKIAGPPQTNQVAVTILAAETVGVTQAGNQAETILPVQSQQVNQVQDVKVENAIQPTDTVKPKQSNQGTLTAVAATVTTGAVVAAQPKPGTQVSQPAQTKPATTAPQQAQTKPATTVPQQAQTKPVTTAPQQAQTKPVTQATVTTAVTQPPKQVQNANPAQNVQSSQQASAYQSNPPEKQYNQFPVVENIFESPGPSRRKWYRGIIEIGYGFGLGDYGINNFRFNFINAIRIGQYSSIGLGLGYRHLFTENSTAPYLVSSVKRIPVFLDLRTSFSAKKLTPYLAVGVGSTTGYGSTDSQENGLLFNASGGIWFNVSPRFAIFAGLGLEIMKLEFSDTDPFADNYKKNTNSLDINIGISF